MNGRAGIPLVLLAGALVLLGVTLGAVNQKETFLGNQENDDPAVAGDITVLTSFLVGLGTVLFLMVLGNAPGVQRISAALVGGAATWFMVFLVQGAWPNYVVIPEHGSASILQSNLLLESVGAPSVLLPLFALGIFVLIGLGWGLHAARIIDREEATLSRIRRDHLAIAALAVPTLVVTAAGMLRVMLELPADFPGQGLITILHPLAAAACLLIAITVGLRAHQVARLRNDPDLTWPVMESWRTLDRIDLAGIIALALVAALSTFLPSEAADVTSSGPTLVFTPRSHGQAIMFLAAVLVPLHILHRRIGDLLPTARKEPEPEDARTRHAAWILTGTVGTASLLAIILTFVASRALMPWIVALVPAGIVAGIVGRPIPSSLVRCIAAWALWGAGNTIQASYQAANFPDLEFVVHPGIRALWRMASAAMLAWVVFDVLDEVGRDERTHVRVPLSLTAAVGAALVALLLFPLNVWAESAIPADKVAVGSLLRSQQVGVQVVMHMIASVSGLGATIASVRLLRPEWFRRGRGADASAPSTTPA